MQQRPRRQPSGSGIGGQQRTPPRSSSAPRSRDPRSWSADDVAAAVAALGPAFEAYRDLVLQNAIDGIQMLEMDDEEVSEERVPETWQSALPASGMHSLRMHASDSCSQCDLL